MTQKIVAATALEAALKGGGTALTVRLNSDTTY